MVEVPYELNLYLVSFEHLTGLYTYIQLNSPDLGLITYVKWSKS